MAVVPRLSPGSRVAHFIAALVLLPFARCIVPSSAAAQSEATLPDAPIAATSVEPITQSESPVAAEEKAELDFGSGGITGLSDATGATPSAASRGRDDSFAYGPAMDGALYRPMDVQPNRGAHVNIDLNALFGSMDRPASTSAVFSPAQAPEKYHVKLLLWESLAFIGTENLWRLFTDSYMRRLVADDPFWQNYADSLGQWNMGRWWDGDDFLVDYIGHPMQGGVSSFIEIQNSPRQRALRLGKSREYWRSRFLGMMWATVFSTQQKIGPLGEAALGNDGGYTYPLNCPYPCKGFTPGVTKYTNNTGWTDFIATPVIGSLWVVLEDAIDREISDRIQKDNLNAVLPKIIRGGLNPCRTMANFMRWRKPWYRDFQQYDPANHVTRGIHFLPGDEEVIRRAPRSELFPHVSSISLPVNTAACFRCRQTLYGYGAEFSTRINRFSDFDSDIDYHSNASPAPSDRAGGSIVMGTFGLRGGWTGAYGALKAAIRPGFLSYSRAYETSPVAGKPLPDTGRITHFITALAINGDIDINRHFGIRGVIGNTPVRYRSNQTHFIVVQKPPYFNFLSRALFITNENWTWQAGPVIRF